MPILKKIEDNVREIYKTNFGKYPLSHDFLHVLRVLRLAERIASEEGLKDEKEFLALRLAVFLHDIGIAVTGKKEKHAEVSAQLAEQMLREHGADGELIQLVCQAIREHSWKLQSRPSTMVSAILQDADRLDALGLIGLIRMYTYSVQLGRIFYCEKEPIPRQRQPNDRVYTLDHVYVKLIKISEKMNTRAGKNIAEKRMKKLLEAVKALVEEVQGLD